MEVKNKIIRATVIAIIGRKDGTFISEATSPDVEPWFVVNCRFLGLSDRSYFTKDAKSFYDTCSFYSSPRALRNNLTWRFWERERYAKPGHFDFTLDNHRLVKEAIERYVTEVAEPWKK